MVHLYQVKHAATFDNARHNFPSNEIDKVLSYISDMLNKNAELRRTVNPLLWQKTQDIWAAYDQGNTSVVVHFCGNMDRLIRPQRDRIVAALERFHMTFQDHTLSSIVAAILESKAPPIDCTLQLVDDQVFERVDGTIKGLVATVEATKLVELIRDPDDPDSVRHAIFDDNVRIYLTTKNEINKKIVRSALSDDNHVFWYLNNGITMTCDSFVYPPGVRAPVVTLKNLQIVNGGQTSNALFEAYRTDKEKLRKVLLLIRIYETRQREISQLIAETTNSQTPVRSRDLRANDDVQKKLEDAFEKLGYFYERKANQYKDKDRTRRIDALSAGQAYVAYWMDLPHIGKKEKRRIFDDLYESVFNDSITPQRLLAPFLVHAHIDGLKKELQASIRRSETFKPDHLILLDGVYHVLNATRMLLELRQEDEGDAASAIAVTDSALYIVGGMVSREMIANPAFSTSRLFKDRRTTKKIHDAIREYVARAG